MSASRHFKLGLFALCAGSGLIAIAFVLGVRGVGPATVEYHTYFDESVQGLEVGSPVKYRGVRIGSVADIAIAPDRRHVDVTFSVRLDDAQQLGLERVALEVRAELGTQGITGVKYIDLDVVPPGTARPTLSFPVAEHYVPARPSLIKGLEDNLELVGDRLPGLVDRTTAALDKLAVVLDDLHAQQVPERISTLLADLDGVTADARRLIVRVDRAGLADRAGVAIEDVRKTLASTREALDGVGGDRGLVSRATRAFGSIGDVAAGARGSTADLERTLRDLDDAALSIRDFFDELDRDPDMLLKGRGRVARP